MDLPTPAEMAAWDAETIREFGIPGPVLMETAARQALAVLREEAGDPAGLTVYCFAGPGNNGGDAFAMARHLKDMDADVTVFHTRPKKLYRGDARLNLLLAQKAGVRLTYLTSQEAATLPQPDIIIDGLLGTGFSGTLRPDALEMIRAINALGQRAFVLAVDIPSGLDGLTGAPCPEAVRADATATFEAPKLGLAMPEAADHTGMIHVLPIGIPAVVKEKLPASQSLLTSRTMRLLPHPHPRMHKGTAGKVAIIGGSTSFTGAPKLAGLAALRAGAGLVTVACPYKLANSIIGDTPDLMALHLDSKREWTPGLAEQLAGEAHRFDAAVIGPGLGRELQTVDFIRAFVTAWSGPLVYDADALYALAQAPHLLAQLPDNAVLTPHPAEMARLLDKSVEQVQADRLGAARELKAKTRATVVLKGAATIVIGHSHCALAPFSEPNLAVGGSGDVLAGMLGALLARGMNPEYAACLAVYWHGLAGRTLREEFPLRGNTASEIANILPLVAKENVSC